MNKFTKKIVAYVVIHIQIQIHNIILLDMETENNNSYTREDIEKMVRILTGKEKSWYIGGRSRKRMMDSNFNFNRLEAITSYSTKIDMFQDPELHDLTLYNLKHGETWKVISEIFIHDITKAIAYNNVVAFVALYDNGPEHEILLDKHGKTLFELVINDNTLDIDTINFVLLFFYNHGFESPDNDPYENYESFYNWAKYQEHIDI